MIRDRIQTILLFCDGLGEIKAKQSQFDECSIEIGFENLDVGNAPLYHMRFNQILSFVYNKYIPNLDMYFHKKLTEDTLRRIQSDIIDHQSKLLAEGKHSAIEELKRLMIESVDNDRDVLINSIKYKY